MYALSLCFVYPYYACHRSYAIILSIVDPIDRGLLNSNRPIYRPKTIAPWPMSLNTLMGDLLPSPMRQRCAQLPCVSMARPQSPRWSRDPVTYHPAGPRGAEVPWCRGPIVPGFHSAGVPWCHDPWCRCSR